MNPNSVGIGLVVILIILFELKMTQNDKKRRETLQQARQIAMRHRKAV